MEYEVGLETGGGGGGGGGGGILGCSPSYEQSFMGSYEGPLV